MRSSKQQGLTFIGLLLVLGFIGIITLSVLKVFPVYMEHFAVKTALESLENDQSIKEMSVSEIRGLFGKKLDINQVTSINAKDAKISRSTGEITMKVEYEVRKDYIGNVDIILSFSDQFDIPL